MSALDIVARGLAARALDSGSVTSIDGATNRTAAAKLASDVPLSLLDFYETGEPDMTNAVTRLSAAILASGGNRTVLLPRAGAPYESAAPLVIRHSGVRLIIDNPFVYTGSEPVDFIEIRPADDPTTIDDYLTGIVVELNADVDMQGGGIDWTYETGWGGNAVHLVFCRGARVIGRGEIRNGLVDCLKFTCAKDCVADGVTVRGAVNDNGFSFDQQPFDCDPADRSTWGNNIVRNVVAIGCRDFGITLFDSPGSKILNCEAYRCGTDGANAQTLVETFPGSDVLVVDRPGASGGGFSFEGYAADGPLAYEGRGLRAYDCFTRGIALTVDDVVLVDCMVDGVHSQSADVQQGHGIVLIANGYSTLDGVKATRAVWRNCRVKRAAKCGFAAMSVGAGSGIQLPAIRFEGTCVAEANSQQGFFANGWASLESNGTIEARRNNTGASFAASDFEIDFVHQDPSTTGGVLSLGRVRSIGTSKYRLRIRKAIEASVPEILYDQTRDGTTIAQPIVFDTITGTARFGRVSGVERTTASVPAQIVLFISVGTADVGKISANIAYSGNVPYGFSGVIGAVRGELFSPTSPVAPANAAVEKGQVFSHPAPGAGGVSRWRCSTAGTIGGTAVFKPGETLAA